MRKPQFTARCAAGPATPTTHLSPTLDGPPDHPLTDEEILDRHGALMWGFMVLAATDPIVLAEIVEHANENDARRDDSLELRATSVTEAGWRCPECDAMLRPKGSRSPAAVEYRHRPGTRHRKWDAHCRACGAKAHS